MSSISSAASAALSSDSSEQDSKPSLSVNQTMLVLRISPDDGRTYRCSGMCAHLPSSPASVMCSVVDSLASPSAPHLEAAKPRSDLWPEFIRVVRDARPSWVVAENVPGIADEGIERVCGDLEAAGYSVWAFDTDTALPARQRGRHRIIWLAHSDDAVHPRLSIDAEVASLCEISGSRWQNDPAPVGMDDELSRRMDRFGQLGNALTPYFAEIIGRTIMSTQHPTSSERQP